MENLIDMIYRYYLNINKNEKGLHELHSENCFFVPIRQRRIDFGWFENSKEALAEARKYYPNISGCYWCCAELLVER